jgi:protein-S-isoprenylcysteine O-methyltransferase Ste14
MELNRATVSLWVRAYLYMLLFGGSWFVLLPTILLLVAGDFPPGIRPLPWPVLGSCFFLSGVLLSWVAAYHLVVVGRGTPFPLDPTRKLVTSGPYAYVRNPQAIATMLMVMGEGAALRSTALLWLLPLTVLYLEFLAAPYEHREMKLRFGDAYINYRARVPKWLPINRREN